MRRQEITSRPDIAQLSVEQEKTVRKILDILKTPPEQGRKLIILQGPSGIGKTTILQNVEQNAHLLHGRIVDPDDLRVESASQDLRGFHGHLITSESTGEMKGFRGPLQKAVKITHPDLQTTILSLGGLSQQETESYIVKKSHGFLAQDLVLRYSLGVPVLVQRLTQEGITEEIARRMCARYLWENFPGYYKPEDLRKAAGKYLHIPVDSSVLEVVHEMYESFTPQHIYDVLYQSLNKMHELLSIGIREESPLFVAPESELIYDRMMQSDGVSNIDIFVPNLKDQDLQRIFQALGYDGNYSYREDLATRKKLIPASYRKVSFWHRTDRGIPIAQANELSYLESQALNYVKAYENGTLGLTPESGEKGQFYIHGHAHYGETSHTAYLGWMVESLLQQRGISYFVNNETYGASYIYNPQTKHIEIFPKRVEIERW